MHAHNRHDHLAWDELDREVVADGSVFQVVASHRRARDGREGRYYLLDTPDWANVVALTTDDDGREAFVMVRQFRHGAMKVCLEFPGGIVDPGEDVQTAVIRELAEETGYVPGRVRELGNVNPNPALMGNRVHTFLAEDCTPSHRQDLDTNEIIDVALVPVEDLINGAHADEFDHAIMLVALSFFVNDRNGG